MPPAGDPPDATPYGLILAILIIIIATTGVGALFYQSQEHQISERVTRDLTAIVKLKSEQITGWREDRLHDGRVISSSSFFIEGADHFFTYSDDESKEKILSRFREMNASPQYQNILLVDVQGNVRLSLDPSVTSLHPSVNTQVAAALAGGEAVMTDFYSVPGSGQIHQSVIAPLQITSNGSKKPVGAVILSINPDRYLYPYIQSWPVPSESAETLLVEREGYHVLFLNDLRHQDNTALNLTIPLTQTDVPAVMAVLGSTGAFTGKDYRNVDVISVLEPISGSPWFIVAKIDRAEAFAAWRSQSMLIIVIVAGTLAGAIIITGLVWQRRQKYYYRSLYTAEAGRREEEQMSHERSESLLILAGMESANEQELLDYALDAVCRLTKSPLAFVGLMAPHGTVFDRTSWSKSAMQDCSIAASPIPFPIENAGIWAEAVRQRKPLILNDYPAPLPGKKGIPPGHVAINRFVSVPVFEEQRIVMVCTVANKEKDYTPRDVDNLTILMQGVWNHLGKRKADEALRQKNAELEAAFEKITASEEEIRANYEELATIQQSLKESEERFRLFIMHAPAALAMFDRNMRYLAVSPRWIADYHLTGREIIGQSHYSIFPEIPGSLKAVHQRGLAGEVVSSSEDMFVRQDGSAQWIAWEMRPWYTKGNQVGGIIIFSENITERRQSEQQRERLIRELELKNTELERFAYTISHDLKSPLITIKGFSGLLEDDAHKCDAIQLKADIQHIIRAADTMQQLLSDVLELSRIGRLVSPPEKTPFGLIVQEAAELLAMSLAERNVSLVIAPDLPEVIVDHVRIREVMVNLIENAIKYTGNRPDPVIRIGVDRSSGTPVFFVQDNGIGINPRYLERIFNLFEKLNPSYSGTGVGLTIVKRIIEVHGGKIWAESEGEGKGTTFRFTLPAAHGNPEKID